MKFLTDENISPRIVRVLRAAKHNVWDIKENDWQGAFDEKIMAYALRTKRVIISEDLDFANLRRFPLRQYSGAILLHFFNMRPRHIADRLLLFLATIKPVQLRQAVFLLEENHWWRIKPKAS